MIGWDNPKTVHYYEAFCERHDRYSAASRELVSRAGLRPGMRVIDLGAGIGGTAAMMLPFLGEDGSVLCMEPAEAMRRRGMSLQPDSRVAWNGTLPEGPECFDRIICSAAMWQMLPLPDTFARLHSLLRPGGLLCFNIPAQYLGDPDEPGGGEDPLLLDLMRRVAEGRESKAPRTEPLPTAEGMDRLLLSTGFIPERWTTRRRLTQEAYRDWLKIPVITDRLLGDLDPDDRAALIDEAFKEVDQCSWRWERWYGWTARRRSG